MTEKHYIPSQSKRYEVSEDKFSRERAKLMSNIHHALERQTGIPLSFSLFGSLVKGKKLNERNADSADIDVFIDIDEDALSAMDREKKIIVIKNLREFSGLAEIIRTIRKETGEDLEESDQQIRALTDSELNYSIRDLLKHSVVKMFDEKEDAVGRVEFNLAPRAVNLELVRKKINEYENKLKDVSRVLRPNEEIRMRVNIAGYFTLSVGGVIKKYREQYLRELAEDKDEERAEKTWQIIREIVEYTERRGRIPGNLKPQFPKTLKEALRFYGVKSNAK